MFDLRAHLARQRDFSRKTFGPGPRTAGVLDHIRKELREIEAVDGDDIEEWVDVVILAFDGALRKGYSPDQIIATLESKQAKNEARTWPDWRTVPADKAIEHVRDEETPVQKAERDYREALAAWPTSGVNGDFRLEEAARKLREVREAERAEWRE